MMGERTIGVLTKVDLMDEGTSVMDIVRGGVYPLRLGYIPVICRSQKDIVDGKFLKSALEKEKSYFSTHEDYRHMCTKCGIPYLTRNLNEIIVKHIKKNLPLIRSKLMSILYQKEKELKAIHLSPDVKV